eukprot:1136663-Pelagomonas_calceolata.AAC.2
MPSVYTIFSIKCTCRSFTLGWRGCLTWVVVLDSCGCYACCVTHGVRRRRRRRRRRKDKQ